jgi:hypothetical protein
VDGQRLQQFVTSSPWDVEPIRKTLSEKACTLIDPDAWVIDDTGFVKDGDASVRVARQYSGALGCDTTAFRQGLTDRQIGYVVAVKGATSAYPGDATPETTPYPGRGRRPIPRYRDPHQSCRDLAVAADAPPAKQGRSWTGWHHHATLAVHHHPAADQPKSQWAGLTLYGIVRELQRALAHWIGACPLCHHSFPNKALLAWIFRGILGDRVLGWRKCLSCRE